MVISERIRHFEVVDPSEKNGVSKFKLINWICKFRHLFTPSFYFKPRGRKLYTFLNFTGLSKVNLYMTLSDITFFLLLIKLSSQPHSKHPQLPDNAQSSESQPQPHKGQSYCLEPSYRQLRNIQKPELLHFHSELQGHSWNDHRY